MVASSLRICRCTGSRDFDRARRTGDLALAWLAMLGAADQLTHAPTAVPLGDVKLLLESVAPGEQIDDRCAQARGVRVGGRSCPV